MEPVPLDDSPLDGWASPSARAAGTIEKQQITTRKMMRMLFDFIERSPVAFIMNVMVYMETTRYDFEWIRIVFKIT